MSLSIQCPKCGGELSTWQNNNRKTSQCRRCGPLPFRDGEPEIGMSGYFRVEQMPKKPEGGHE